MRRSNLYAFCLAAGLFAVSIVSSPVRAQASPIGKGSWIISGSAGASSQHVDGLSSSVTSISLAPSALYFFAPGVAFGGAVSLGYQSNPSSSIKSFGIGPSIRYYFADQAAKTLPFISATVAPTWSSNDPKNSSSTLSGHTVILEGTAGFTHLLVPHVAITGEAYYDHVQFNGNVGSSTTIQASYSFGVRFGLTAFLY